MCDEKKKCSKKTRKILFDEKKRVMNETLEHLKNLREVLELRQAV